MYPIDLAASQVYCASTRFGRSGPRATIEGDLMYLHRQELQHNAVPDKPDAVYARKLQEVLGGQYGEITVAMQYQFQA